EVERARLRIADVDLHPARRDEVRDRFERAPEDLLRRVELRQRLGEAEQRGRRLRGLPLEAEETRFLEADRGVRREDLEQAHVLVVELVDAEAREDDHAGRSVAVAE